MALEFSKKGNKKISTLNKKLLNKVNQMKQIKDGMPTANIAINKSRLKLYKGDVPTYYLSKGQEFQIELFNPTKDTILAKIHLNSKPITQGGLVLRPGERVFLDRYIDVAKKFLFDTYEVSGKNDEVKKAIEDNGNFKVDFYKEKEIKKNPIIRINDDFIGRQYAGGLNNNDNSQHYLRNLDITSRPINSGSPYPNDFQYTTSNSTGNLNNTINTTLSSTNSSQTFTTTSFFNQSSMPTLDWMDTELSRSVEPSNKKSKKIETGIVEEGSNSDQEMVFVNKDWEYFSFHSIEYKLLPLSQKVNTTQDISVKRYCTSCGKKVNKQDNYCGKCGNKV